jgi:hypothetical protein
MPILRESLARFWVSSCPGEWLQATCSLRFTLSTVAVGKEKTSVLTRGEQAAMTTVLTPSFSMSSLIRPTSSRQKAGEELTTGI